MEKVNLKEVAQSMQILEDNARRFCIEHKNHKIDYEKLWKTFKEDCFRIGGKDDKCL